MNALKKIAVVLPVAVIGWFYLYGHSFQYTGKRLMALLLSALLFGLWVAIGVARRKQTSLLEVVLQASFYVYIFSVLTLTGYFVFFNHVSAHGWWHNMVHRVAARDGVSLEPFLFLKARHMLTFDVVGNFIMLLPLGIYLPLLYKRINHLFSVCLVALLVSVCIELMQLATNFRVTDINDVILNTAGAALGFVVYYIFYVLVIKPLHTGRYPATA